MTQQTIGSVVFGPNGNTPTAIGGNDKPHMQMVYPTEKITELLAKNRRLREALKDIITAQERNYGNATLLHIEMIGLVGTARVVIAEAGE